MNVVIGRCGYAEPTEEGAEECHRNGNKARDGQSRPKRRALHGPYSTVGRGPRARLAI